MSSSIRQEPTAVAICVVGTSNPLIGHEGFFVFSCYFFLEGKTAETIFAASQAGASIPTERIDVNMELGHE